MSVVACTGSKLGGKGGTPVDKELLPGKWKASEEDQYVAEFEFNADGTMKMRVKELEEPVPGKYSWSGDRSINLEFQATEEIKKAYAAAIKRLKAPRLKGLGNQKGPIADNMRRTIDAIPDELKAETYKVVIEKRKAEQLTLTGDSGYSLEFKKVK